MERLRKVLVMMLVVVSTAPCVMPGFLLSPMEADFSTSGSASTRIYTVENDTDDPVAIWVKIRKQNVQEGEIVYEDGNAYFSVSPQKMIVKPQSTQLVRVQYRGPSVVPRELSFLFSFEQVPYELGKTTKAPVQLAFVYSFAAYVAPSKIIERVSCSAEITDEGMLRLRLRNEGNVHQVLNDLSVMLEDGDGNEYLLSSKELEGWSGKIISVAAEAEKEMALPLGFDGTDMISCRVTYDYEYGLR